MLIYTSDYPGLKDKREARNEIAIPAIFAVIK